MGFALLENGAGEIMLQTRASLEGDLPLVAARSPSALLFVEVDSLAQVQAATRANAIVAERTTFYGMRETVVVDPAGTVIIFAQKE